MTRHTSTSEAAADLHRSSFVSTSLIMPPPSDSLALHLHISQNTFFVIQLTAGSAMPSNVLEALSSNEGRFLSVTKTKEELSIVGERYDGMPPEYEKQCDWACIKIRGPMEHSLVGVLASFSAPLKAAGVPIFALSTW
ncbi:hypothetical protein BKA70DRAFT_1247810 [Coprinopsis sp. MPI-PUGE-AT-0042]|nr:hypothetical protein BKA70DRAFT_1247810 [Coprinopsis sp. MPI-PUGE-AT-0042]